jgi:RNase P protein component
MAGNYLTIVQLTDNINNSIYKVFLATIVTTHHSKEAIRRNRIIIIINIIRNNILNNSKGEIIIVRHFCVVCNMSNFLPAGTILILHHMQEIITTLIMRI